MDKTRDRKRNVSRLTIVYCGSTDSPVRFEDIGLSPRINSQADSRPQIWEREQLHQVSVTVPVHVVSDAESGAYAYGFQIAGDIGERNSRDYEYTITVGENDSIGTLTS